MKLTVVLVAVSIGWAQLAFAQTRRKPMGTMRWASATVEVEAGSDSTVRLSVTDLPVAARPRSRVDYLQAWIASAKRAMSLRPNLEPGEYMEMPEFGEGQIRVTRLAYTDSSRYLVSFYGTGSTLPLIASANERQFTWLVNALQAADTASRRMSGLSGSWDARR